MQHEIEIKLIVSNNIEETLKDLSEKQDVKLIEQQFALENIYFDTPDKKLRQKNLKIKELIFSHIQEPPPINLNNGGAIKNSVSNELDNLRNIKI